MPSEVLAQLVDRLDRLFAAGDLTQAASVVRSYEATDPGRHALGLAALAAHAQDAAGTAAHAERALALHPDEPSILHYLAVAALMRGERDAAEAHAAAAIEHGGGVRSLGWLANLQLGAGKPSAAEATYRRMLELAPTSVQALNGLGACRYKQQDLDGAVGFLARAFDADPTDPQPIRSMMNMYGDAGRVLGAIALGNMTRERHADDASRLAIDLMLLNLNHVLMGGYPPPKASPDADAAITAIVGSAADRPASVRLGVARALVDCQRFDDAQRIVAAVEAGPLAPPDRGNAAYVRGLIAQHTGDTSRALAAYEAAVSADPRRWDACCNGLTILLERGDADALARAEALLAHVPADVKTTAPQLLFNEAVLRHRGGRDAEARRNLDRVLAATRGEGELGALAQQLLTEVNHG